jgi:hypothetical protein
MIFSFATYFEWKQQTPNRPPFAFQPQADPFMMDQQFSFQNQQQQQPQQMSSGSIFEASFSNDFFSQYPPIPAIARNMQQVIFFSDPL